MKPFEIFRAGKHTSTSGTTAEYSEAMLRAAVEAYDPALHPAPIVVGHPHDNHPAYGWVGSLSLDESGTIIAEPTDVNADFAELVQRKAYRTRSASWYLPDAPHNPKPGSMYLRHVGFLGAQPPAIKGLKDVSFSDHEEGVVEFGDRYQTGILARLFRSMREFFVEKYGIETANRVLPDNEIQEVEYQARAPEPRGEEPAFAEQAPTPTKEITVTAEEKAAVEAENARLKADLEKAQAAAQQSADFAEREAQLAQRANELARRELETKVDALIAAGKVLPANKARVIDFAASLSDEGECLDFAEAGKGKDVLTQRASYLRLLEQGPKLVEFGEMSRDERQADKKVISPRELGEKAAAYRAEQRKKGIEISTTDAVAHFAETHTIAG